MALFSFMDFSMLDYWNKLMGSPFLWIVSALIIGVILVNGWTDAPNAIAACVTTRAIHPRLAILMAAVFNFLGVFLMTMLAPAVADTITKMVNFGDDTNAALIALSAAMFAIVTWAVLAWKFGIPTSESHALIAGITGSAIAMHGGFAGVNGSQWLKVLYGIGVSLVLGFGLAFLITKLIHRTCRDVDYRKANRWFGKGSVAAAAGTAFMHGAQDGQKFMGIFLLGMALSDGNTTFSLGEGVIPPLWLMILCSLIMAAGTMMGGMKIIKSVGMDMVKMEKYQGFAADVSATVGLLACSALGMPVSTTHAKTMSIMGVGAAKSWRSLNLNVVKEMVLTWVLTFPGCGLIGFLMTKLFIYIF